jgi:flagellar motor switch protein FliM
MAEGFLSQGEVDALLRGVSDHEEVVPLIEDVKEVLAYNMGAQERIVRGSMPTLEIINERFVRLMRIALFNFMRRAIEVTVGPVQVIKYGEFIRNLVVPTNLNLVTIKPFRGTSLVVFDPSLVFAIIDCMFGGDGRFHTRIEGRDFTMVEYRIIQRTLEIVFSNYEAAWAPVHKIECEYIRSEMNTQFANIATPNELVITCSFSVEVGSATGSFHICIPSSSFDPIRDLLKSSVSGDGAGSDQSWGRLLTKEIKTAEVELVATLGQTSLNIAELIALKVGDMIPLVLNEQVEVCVENVPVMSCRYGTFDGHYALRVERFLKADSEEYVKGDTNGN